MPSCGGDRKQFQLSKCCPQRKKDIEQQSWESIAVWDFEERLITTVSNNTKHDKRMAWACCQHHPMSELHIWVSLKVIFSPLRGCQRRLENESSPKGEQENVPNAESLVMIMITVFSSCRWHFNFQELGETLINGQRASLLTKPRKAISERDLKQIATLCFMHNWVGKAFLNVND